MEDTVLNKVKSYDLGKDPVSNDMSKTQWIVLER